MWELVARHKDDVALVAAFWLAVQVAAGMPTPRANSSTTYRWVFNVAHSLTNLPRLLATAFPEVSWIAAFFGLGRNSAGQTTGGGSVQ